MAWAVPQNKRDVVNKAGRLLTGDMTDIAEYLDALTVINNWRASHAFPLNTFQTNLRKKGKAVDEDCLIA